MFVSIKDFLWTSILQIYHHKMVVMTCARHNIRFICEGAPHRGKKVYDCSCLTNKRTTTCLYLCTENLYLAWSTIYPMEQDQQHHRVRARKSSLNRLSNPINPITPTFFIVIWCNAIPLMQQIHGQVQLNVSQVLYM